MQGIVISWMMDKQVNENLRSRLSLDAENKGSFSWEDIHPLFETYNIMFLHEEDDAVVFVEKKPHRFTHR